jgi:hypothetical protein
MIQNNFKMFASSLATYARKELSTNPRGSLLIRLVGEDKVIGGIYGHANYVADPRVRQEVALIRQRLKEAAVEVLQFGLSLDGLTWALLVRIDDQRYQTQSGRLLRREMLKALLDDVVQDVARTLYGAPPDADDWRRHVNPPEA